MADTILSRLEEKFQLLLKKMQSLQQEHQRLQQTVAQKTLELDDQMLKIQDLENQLVTARIAATTVSPENGSAGNGHELKKKLNKYIKEIDHCIAQLNE